MVEGYRPRSSVEWSLRDFKAIGPTLSIAFADCPEQGVGEAKGQRRGERVGYEPEPRLSCESSLSATQATVEAPLRSEPSGRAEKLRRE